jgi:conjugal transfer/entry exclusion protein
MNVNLKVKKASTRNLSKVLALLALSATAIPAVAGGGAGGSIVFDPTNYAQNLQTAAHTLAQEQMQITSAVREVQMLANSVKNVSNTVKNLSGITSITGAEQTISSLMSQWNVDKSLMDQLGGQANFVQGVMLQYGANPTTGSFTTYVQNLATQSAAGQQNATSLISNYTNMSSELQKTLQQRQSIAAQNSGLLGTNDSIAVTNASLDNISEINQATLQGIQTMVRQAAYKQSVDAADTASTQQAASNASAMAQKAANGVSSVPAATNILGY